MATASLAAHEHALLRRHCEGDRRAFTELIEVYRRPVYAYLCRCGIPAEARDDVAQDIFMKLHAAAPRYAPDKPLRAFVFTVVANTARSYFRKRSVWARFFSRESTVPEPASKAPASDAETQARETAAFVDQSLESLSAVQREVVLLRATAHLEMEEIAAALGLPTNTVKTHLRRARFVLAKKLAERELGDEGAA